MKKATATIENITPPTERDLGGVTVYLVEVTFRLDEQDDQTSIATQACLEELDKVWGVSQDTGRLWQRTGRKVFIRLRMEFSLPRYLPIPAGRSAKN